MPGPTAKKPRVSPRETVHDDLNRGIIEMLQQDGRIAFSAIAAKLGVSEGAIRKRVNRLQDSGAIRVVAVVDPMELSYDAYTMLGLKVSPGINPDKVAQRLAEIDEVVYAIWTSGPYDVLIEVIFEDRERFVEFLSNEVYEHTDVQNCDVMQTNKVIKNQYQLKPNFRAL